METTQQRPGMPSCGPIFAVGLALWASALAAHTAGSVARRAAEVHRRVDLTTVVIKCVDLDAVIRAVAERIDVGGLAEEVLGTIDLPEIIRQSTGAMATGFVRRARVQGIAADEAVGRVRNRLLRRPTRGPA